MTRTLLRVTGTVQGVGFRPFVYRHAVALGLAGSVRNDSAGVLIDVEGEPERIAELDARPHRGSAAARARRDGHVGARGAARRARRLLDRGERRVGLPVGAGERRHRHVRRLPGRGRRSRRPPVPLPVHELHELRAALHDRARRALRPPGHDHARLRDVCGLPGRVRRSRPTAASTRNPTRARSAGRSSRGATPPAARSPTATTRSPPRSTRSAAGRSSAVKGIGGYHLAVDATNADAVRELRRRKARDDKPFAVMVPDLAAARVAL